MPNPQDFVSGLTKTVEFNADDLGCCCFVREKFRAYKEGKEHQGKLGLPKIASSNTHNRRMKLVDNLLTGFNGS
jgi:hypothetical protein